MIDNVELKKIQKEELAILKEIDRICKKYAITYFLIGGTLLGAVRHKGFIPWDDDLDICMFRDDYKRFIEIALRELSDPYCLLDLQTDSSYYYGFAKVIKNDTEYCEKNDFKLKGLWVDIFPIDKILIKTTNKNKASINELIRNAMIYKLYKELDIKKENYIKEKVYIFLVRTLSLLSMHQLSDCRLFFLSSKRKSCKYCVNFSSSYGWKKQTMPIEYYFPPKKTQFEDSEFPIPNNSDAVLRLVYGDYMKLPPIEQRGARHALIRKGEE